MQGELYPPQGAVTLEQALESESEERKRRKKKPKGNDEDDGKVGKNETEGGEVSKDSALDGEDEEKKKKSDGDGSSGKKKKKKKSGGGSSLANSRKKTKKGSKKVKEDEDGEGGDGESGSSKKKKKKESKEEKKKTRKNLKALAATLPNPRIASSSSASSTSPSPSSTTSPSSNGYAASNAQFSASSGKISLAAKSKSSDSASRLGGALTWNDLPDTPIKKKKTKSSSSSIKNKKKRQDAGGGGSDSDALVAAEDDVEEWERSGSGDAVLCTIGHFKQLSLSDEGRRFDPKAGPVDDGGGDNHDEVADAVDGNDDGDDSDVDDERLKLPLPKENDESGCSKDELRLSPRGWADLSIAGSGGGGGSAPTTSRTASPDAKCAQLHKLRSMEPTVVWRSLQKADLLGLVASPGAPPADDGGRSERKKRTDMLWQELIDTEINYVKNLNTIIQVPNSTQHATRPTTHAID
jgi:hypothetical protein